MKRQISKNNNRSNSKALRCNNNHIFASTTATEGNNNNNINNNDNKNNCSSSSSAKALKQKNYSSSREISLLNRPPQVPPGKAIGKRRRGEHEDDGQLHLLYSTDWEKSALVSNFQKRGWLQVPSFEGEWNFYWACTQNCRYIFGVDHPYRMRADQMINHFPNSVELSRKDLLIKNIKRYRKDLERKGDPLAEMYPNVLKLGIGGTRYVHLDIIPLTFVLPADYNLFVEAFQTYPSTTWIVKPCSKSQGEGIFLVNKLSKLKKYAYDARTFYMPHFNRETCVISKYIDNPLLIGGKKFDLRLYVLVTTFNPLKAYLYNEGFCRFCIEKYDETEIDNVFMHLTNVSIQKTNEEYNAIHGGKWPMQNLWLYLDSTRGEGVSEVLWTTISQTIRHSLDAVAPVMANDRHCFEVYGYDIIIDNNLKPWLIEINTSPSMHSTTTNDRMLKSRLIDNVLAVILPPGGLPDVRWDKTPAKTSLQNFTLLTPASQLQTSPIRVCKPNAANIMYKVKSTENVVKKRVKGAKKRAAASSLKANAQPQLKAATREIAVTRSTAASRAKMALRATVVKTATGISAKAVAKTTPQPLLTPISTTKRQTEALSPSQRSRINKRKHFK